MISPRTILLSVLMVTGLVGVGVAFQSADTDPEVRFTDQAVEAVHPPAGNLDLRQVRIGIDLKTSYRAVLAVDGREIPEDQLERVPGLGQVFYTPGPGKETGPLRPGRHCATAILWPATESRASARRYSWCFNLH